MQSSKKQRLESHPSSSKMDVEVKEKKFGGVGQEMLRLYYGRLFPFSHMYRWLSYCNNPEVNDPLSEKDYFRRREFSFTLSGDIYLRYQTFGTLKEYKDAYMKKLPEKSDIGAVYNARPDQRNTISTFQPMEKEVVFDIDMTDYDDVRTCCSDAKICLRCWKLMTVAIKILNRALRDDFGFKHLLWVYSGRRGIHCWVCDERARKLTDSGRSAVVSYLSAYIGGDKAQKVKLFDPIHPSLERALQIAEREFVDYVDEQGLLDSEDRWKPILDMIPEPKIKVYLDQRWKERSSNTAEKIADIKKEIRKDINSNKFSKVRTTFEEIIFSHLYPRLDVNVSKGMNHLLKSPWSVHPKTGRVCVPIDPDTCEDFDPFEVPTVEDLMNDINNYECKGKDSKDEKPIQDWQKTRMAPYLEFFKGSFLQPLEAGIRAKRREMAAKYDMSF